MIERIARVAACASTAALIALPMLIQRGDADVAGKERTLLEQAAGTYASLQSYRLEGRYEIESFVDGETQRLEARLAVAGRRPDHMIEELTHPTLGQILVSDGQNTWVYRAALGQYVQQPVAVKPAVDSLSAVESGNVSRGLFIMLRHPLVGATAARTLPAETVTVAERPTRCTVIEVDFPNDVKRTYWIDPATRRIVRHRIAVSHIGAKSETRRVETVTYDRIELDTPIADEVFVFKAPEGARAMASFEAPGQERPDLSGQKAEDFTLADLAGKKHQLSALRGKVVMLDFWATWCGPCRIQMPNVEKLQKEFKDKGLVVYAINQRESADAASRYLKKYAYTTLTLLDSDGAVGEKYQVNGIPSLFVIDRQGTISSHFVGVRDEKTLREALKKAGL